MYLNFKIFKTIIAACMISLFSCDTAAVSPVKLLCRRMPEEQHTLAAQIQLGHQAFQWPFQTLLDNQQPAPQKPRLTVLVVEDNSNIRNVLQRIITHVLGKMYEINFILAGDVNSAAAQYEKYVQTWQAENPGPMFIVTDGKYPIDADNPKELEDPEGGAVKLFHGLKKITPTIPPIILYSAEETIEKIANEITAFAFIRKPAKVAAFKEPLLSLAEKIAPLPAIYWLRKKARETAKAHNGQLPAAIMIFQEHKIWADIIQEQISAIIPGPLLFEQELLEPDDVEMLFRTAIINMPDQQAVHRNQRYEELLQLLQEKEISRIIVITGANKGYEIMKSIHLVNPSQDCIVVTAYRFDQQQSGDKISSIPGTVLWVPKDSSFSLPGLTEALQQMLGIPAGTGTAIPPGPLPQLGAGVTGEPLNTFSLINSAI